VTRHVLRGGPAGNRTRIRTAPRRARAALSALVAVLAAAGPAGAQSVTPTFTSTAVPSTTRTATATFTPTSVPPTRTRTATFTSTSVPPTHTRTFTPTNVASTPTRTATFTSTSVPSTFTPTPTFTPTIGFGLSINDVSILEGDDGARSAVFVVRLRGPRIYPVKVTVQTADHGATAGSDYDALSTILLFKSFESQKTVSVTVRGDRILEMDEMFIVRLGDPAGAPLADAVGVGTILNDDDLRVGVPALSPADPVTAPEELTMLTLRWVHPERWRALRTVDLRLVDDEGPVLWTRFDEAANTFAVCDAAGACGEGVPPGVGAPIGGDRATFHPAESDVQGSGPTGPSVDLVFAFSLDRSLGGRVLRVETAATEDSGEAQAFLPIAYLEVIDTSPGASASDDDGCAIQPGRRGNGALGLLVLGLAALIARAIRRELNETPARMGGGAGRRCVLTEKQER
jgi:Calx-beta domain